MGYAVQPALFEIVIELIDGVEGLKLYSGARVQLGEGYLLMHLGDDSLCAIVAVGIHRTDDLAAVAQENVVDAPGVDGEGLYVGKLS